MSDVLHAISYAMPMTYSIDALDEVGSTSLVSAEYLGDMCAVIGAALLALVLAATTLKRRTGDRTEAQSKRLRAIPLTVIALSIAFLVGYWINTSMYVTTDNAAVDGDKLPIIATASGTLTDWKATLGAGVHDDQVVGRLQLPGAGAPRQPVRAPGEGTVVVDNGVNGSFVTAGTRLGVAYDLSNTYVTARIDESDREDVEIGQRVDVRLDSAPSHPLVGYVQEIQPSTASTFDKKAPDNSMSSFDRYDQVIPVKIVVPDRQGVSFIPGLNVTVKIHKN
jgi:multidrug resistance efflux pump